MIVSSSNKIDKCLYKYTTQVKIHQNKLQLQNSPFLVRLSQQMTTPVADRKKVVTNKHAVALAEIKYKKAE